MPLILLRWVFVKFLGAVARFAVWLTKGLWNHVPGPLPVKLLVTIPAAVVAVVLTILTYLIPVDLTSRIFLSDDPTIVTHDGNPNSNTNITVLGGAGSSPSVQVSELLPTLQQHAKQVRVVEYAEYLFDADEVVDAVDEALSANDREVFVGFSMGGLLSYDVIGQRQAKGDGREFGVVMIDSPTDKEDVPAVHSALKGPSSIGLFSWMGFFTSEAAGPAVGMPPFEPGDPAKMSPYINPAELQKSNESYETWKTSCWSDQGHYVFGHDSLVKRPNVKWAFIQSGSDTFANGDSSYAKWQSSQEGAVLRINGPPKAEHLALHDWPREYAAAMEQGLVSVG